MTVGLTSIKSQFGNLSGQINRSSTASVRDVARLSSGERITRAGDDVASLSVATRMSSRVNSLRSGLINIGQASSYLQVQDGALSQIDGMLQRMNALTVQSVSNLTPAERGFLNQEFQQLYAEIERTLNVTEFNGVNVFADHFNATSAVSTFGFPEETLTLPDGAIVHFDPSDSTTIIDGAGLNASQAGFDSTDVAQILDISGNDNHVSQGNAGERADYVTGINGTSEAAIRFDGINDRYTGTVPTTTQQLTTFVVNNRTLMDGSREFLFEFGANTEAGRDIIGSFGTRPLYFNAFPFGGGAENDFNGTIPFGEYHLISTSLDVSELETYVNGEVDLDITLAGGRERDATTSFTFGDDWTSGDEHTGDIAEFIAYERILSDDERQQVEGYLAQKYDLDLPAGHPYATSGLAIVTGESARINSTLSKGDILGTISPIDSNRTANYDIIDGNNGAFIIDQSDGTIKVNDPSKLNVNTAQYNLTILATLDNGQTSEVSMQIDVGYSGLLFQTDREASESFELDLREFTVDDIFGAVNVDNGFDILSDENAVIAEQIVQTAIDNVTARRAEVGSKQSAADFLGSALEDRLRNQDTARSVVEDTDIASTSTLYAQNTTKTEAAISIAAQANSLREEVLDDIFETGIQVDA